MTRENNLNISDKDVVLTNLLRNGINVAQFVSIDKIGDDEARIRFMRMHGTSFDFPKMTIREAIVKLLERAACDSINIRTFLPGRLSGNPFVYGLTDVDTVIEKVNAFLNDGYIVIVNETIDVNDGGINCVSNVEGFIECACGETPRFVENCKDGMAVFHTRDFISFIGIIYGGDVENDIDSVIADCDSRLRHHRVEFSIHPKPQGVLHKRYLVWESAHRTFDRAVEASFAPKVRNWPNSLSRLIGDKVYGLIMAEMLTFDIRERNVENIIAVPKTTVFAKNKSVGIFQFGTATGAGEVWTRTCPTVPVPGKYPTFQGWADPYSLLNSSELASCIVQDQVNAMFSGSAIVDAENNLVCEFVDGFGDSFMTGENRKFRKMRIAPFVLDQRIEHNILGAAFVPLDFLLPEIWKVINDILRRNYEEIFKFRMEWAYDGHRFWILQLHSDEVLSSGNIIVPGEPENGWVDFEVGKSLEDLRELVTLASEEKKGIRIKARIGITSHIADVCRKAKIPSILG